MKNKDKNKNKNKNKLNLQKNKISSKGTDISDIYLNSLAEWKYISQHINNKLVQIAKKNEDYQSMYSFKSALKCQNDLILSKNQIFKTHYCKSRVCHICIKNKQSRNIAVYLNEISSWEDPHLVLLTARSVNKQSLAREIELIQELFTLLLNRLKKRAADKKGPKPKGIKSRECNFNPITRTYNPHLHLIVPNKELALDFVNEWTFRKFSPSAQGIMQLPRNKKDISQMIAYLNKALIHNTQNNLNLGKPDQIYARAYYNIFNAFRSKQLFRGFGFKLNKQENEELQLELNDKLSLVTYNKVSNNWHNTETGEQLTNFTPCSKLSHQMNSINAELE